MHRLFFSLLLRFVIGFGVIQRLVVLYKILVQQQYCGWIVFKLLSVGFRVFAFVVIIIQHFPEFRTLFLR